MQLEWIKVVLLCASILGCLISLGIQLREAPSEQAQRMGLSPQPDALCETQKREVEACASQGKDCKAERAKEAGCRDRVNKAYVIANLKCVRGKNVVVDCQNGLRTDSSECQGAQKKLDACIKKVLEEYGLDP